MGAACATTPEGVEVRFTAHGDRVWAMCWSPSGTMPGSITLPVRSTPTTSVTALDGATLAAEPVATGLRVETPASDLPIVAIALDHVVAT